MKSITKLALGAAVVLSVAAAIPSVHASCPVPAPLLSSYGAYLISNPDWCGAPADGGPYGCYGGPSVSPQLEGFFWGQTGANAARNVGVDSGGFLVQSWTDTDRAFYDPNGYYYEATTLTDQYGGPFDWSGAGIDSCIDAITPTVQYDECTCMLLTDQWDGQGYFLALSTKSNAAGNFFFFPTVASTVPFGSIPRPEVTGSTRNGGQVTFNINVPPPVGGQHLDPQCNCGIGFRVYAQVTGEGGMIAADRRACTQETLFRATGQSIAPDSPTFVSACRTAGFPWIPATDPTGAPQPFTPFGATRTSTSVTVDCGDPQMGYDVYLATTLGTAEGGGINISNVGTSSFQVKCGDYQLAEPNRPRNPEGPGRSGDAPRGRGTTNRER